MHIAKPSGFRSLPSCSPSTSAPGTAVIPSSFRLPNLIVAGAVDQAGDETNFTSYGNNVLVHADGQAVESVVPDGAKVKMSGTSMAASQVTNLAANLLAINPELTPTEMIALIRDGADTSDDGRRHLLNSRRSAELLESGKVAVSNGSAPLEPHK